MRALNQKQNPLRWPASPAGIKTIAAAAPRAAVATAQPERDEAAPVAEPSADFAHDFARIPVRAQAPMTIQPKLEVNAPGDIYEQEADRVAEHVMRAPEPRLQRACACGDKCDSCQAKQPAQRPAQFQAAHEGASASASTDAPPIVHQAIASSGQPLDSTTRGFMESRFGYDFSGVRVHAGAVAAQSAREVNARAYTVGHDIVFGAGRFAPGTQAGRRLLAHELTHVVQQSGAGRRDAARSLAQREDSPAAAEQPAPLSINAPVTQRMLQRDIGFEFQTENLIVGAKGRHLPRKFGKVLHKVPPSDKNGLELQTDTGSVAEFETFHFRKFSDLEKQVQDAVNVVQDIKKDPKAFPFNQEARLRTEGLLNKGEKLEVLISDTSFKADIQYTEGFALSQFESAAKEHERPEILNPTLKKAQKILDDALKTAKTSGKVKVDNLRGFLQVIVDYILNAQDRPSKRSHVSPVKARFRLMSRTNFSAMFNSVLSADEQSLFKQILKSGAIPTELGLSATDEFFPDGYWGHTGGDLWALYQGGKIVALASEDKTTIHDCASKKKTPGIDTSDCGKKVADTLITLDGWLNSIVSQKKDALSPPPHGGSESMGKFDVQSKGPEANLVVFETRGEVKSRRSRTQPASKWVDYVDEIFLMAATCRSRTG
ncbi:MAG TPA: DUF4157 domain-containing protein, partial [Blastocatellia bacterium]|nr:DUF4157 domain-containing protein [Blastocatellia bacterium]